MTQDLSRWIKFAIAALLVMAAFTVGRLTSTGDDIAPHSHEPAPTTAAAASTTPSRVAAATATEAVPPTSAEEYDCNRISLRDPNAQIWCLREQIATTTTPTTGPPSEAQTG